MAFHIWAQLKPSNFMATGYEMLLDFNAGDDRILAAIPDGVATAWVDGWHSEDSGSLALEIALPEDDDSAFAPISADSAAPMDFSAFAGKVVRLRVTGWAGAVEDAMSASFRLKVDTGLLLPLGVWTASVSFKEPGDKSYFVMPEGLFSICVFEAFGEGSPSLTVRTITGNPVTVSVDPASPTPGADFSGQPVIFEADGLDEGAAAFGVLLAGSYPKCRDWSLCFVSPQDRIVRQIPTAYQSIKTTGRWTGSSDMDLYAKQLGGADEYVLTSDPQTIGSLAGQAIELYIKQSPPEAAVYGVRVYE